MSDHAGYKGPDRRKRTVSGSSIDPQQFGALVATVEALRTSNDKLEKAVTEFMKEQKASQEAHAAQSMAEYEKLAKQVGDLAEKLDDHIEEHEIEDKAAKTGPLAEFRKTFFDTLYKAIAVLTVGGLGFLALQYLNTLGGN